MIYVSEEDAENMITIYSGANLTMTDDEIMALETKLKQANIFLVQLENNFDATYNAMKLAKSLGSTVVPNKPRKRFIRWEFAQLLLH